MRRSSSHRSEPASATWAGCCGVRFGPRGSRDAFGLSRGSPIIDVDLERGFVRADRGGEIWRLTGQVDLPQGVRAYDQRLSSVDGDAFIFDAGNARILVEVSERRVVVESESESITLQLVTAIAIPILLEHEPALVLHACAAIAPGRDAATIVCGRAGAGKSSLLVGLIDAGWRAVSEDLCVVDLRGPTPAVWPGPPWVRRAAEGPAASAGARFQAPDKTAWDISSVRVVDAVPVDEILFLEPAGGERIVRERLSAGDGVGRLTRSTTWLTDPGRRARATFHRVASVSRAIRSARVRFPVADDWIRSAVATVADGPD